MPLSLAPNVITLIGFVGMILGTAWALQSNPNFTGAMPLPVMLFVIFVVFTYQTLDALDGKQARRTQNSTPLGQLFDHGCDAVSMCCFAMLGGLITRSSVDSPFFLAFFFSSLIAFFLAQWEEYWTGVIDLGVVGVTEGQMFGMSLYVVACFWGSEVFLTPAFQVWHFHLTYGDCVLSFLTFAFLSTTVTNIVRVNAATKKSDDKFRALLQLLPLFSLTLAFVVWIRHSPANIAITHPIPLLIAAGIFYPACVERMVLCRLTKDEVPYVYLFTLPAFVGVAQALLLGNAHYDVLLIRINAVVAVVSYLHFAVAVIWQITSYFNIKAFAINRPLQWPLKVRHIDTPIPAKRGAKAATDRGRSKSPKRAKQSLSAKLSAAPSAPAASSSAAKRTRSTSKKRV
jgi:ethanolaminephosphotransferase